MKQFFNRLSRKTRRKNKTHNPAGSVQNLQSPGDLLAYISVLSGPPQGTQNIQENQSPRINTQLAGGAQSFEMYQNEPNNDFTQATQGANQETRSSETSTQLEGGAQSFAVLQTHALHTSGKHVSRAKRWTMPDSAPSTPSAPAPRCAGKHRPALDRLPSGSQRPGFCPIWKFKKRMILIL